MKEELLDKQLKCRTCSKKWVWSAGSQKFYKQKGFKKPKRCKECREESQFEADWDDECMNCGMSPTIPATGMCGPCTFGEADTILGNW